MGLDADAQWQQLEPALAVEPYLFTRRYDDWVASAPSAIHAFIGDRRELITEQLPALSTLGETGLVITAITPTTVAIENRDTWEVELDGCHLSDQIYEIDVLSLADHGGVEPGDALFEQRPAHRGAGAVGEGGDHGRVQGLALVLQVLVKGHAAAPGALLHLLGPI